VAEDQTENQECGRDTEGVVLANGEWGECGAFDDACDENGTQTRTNQVCVDGVQVDQDETGACERDTDGEILATGEWTECGGFADTCDESGERTRVLNVCVNGVAVDQNEVGECDRDTDGILFNEGDFGACEFTDACIETGVQHQPFQECVNGVAQDRENERACDRDSDGTVVNAGAFSDCEGFIDACDETGEQERAAQICRDGVAQLELEVQVCERETDGDRQNEDDWGACGEFDDECDEVGTERRLFRVCRAGSEVEEEESRDCDRDTDGLLINIADFSECGNFDDACDESGTQNRDFQECVNGIAEDRTEVLVC
jgi:hypothetical protein